MVTAGRPLGVLADTCGSIGLVCPPVSVVRRPTGHEHAWQSPAARATTSGTMIVSVRTVRVVTPESYGSPANGGNSGGGTRRFDADW